MNNNKNKSIIKSENPKEIIKPENRSQRGLDYLEQKLQKSGGITSLDKPNLELKVIASTRFKPYCISISMDNRFAMAGCESGHLIFWDLTNGSTLIESCPHSNKIRSVEISPDSRFGISCGDDDQMILWDLLSHKRIFNFRGDIKHIQKVIFSPNSKRIFTGSLFGSIQEWDINTGLEIARFGYPIYPIQYVAVLGLTFSNNGFLLSSCGDFVGIPLWDSISHQLINAIDDHHEDIVRDIIFSPDGRFLFSASRDQQISKCDMSTGGFCGHFEGHTRDVVSIYISSDGKNLASGSMDNSVRIWDVLTREQKYICNEVNDEIVEVVFSSDNKKVIFGCWNGKIYEWDYLFEARNVTNNSISKEFRNLDVDIFEPGLIRSDLGHSSTVLKVWFSNDDRKYYSADDEINVFERSINTGNLITKQHVSVINGISRPDVSFDMKFAITSDPYSFTTFHLYNLEESRKSRSFEHEDTTLVSAFSPNNNWVLTGDLMDICEIRSMKTGITKIILNNVQGPLNIAKFSKDEKFVIAGGLSPVQIWDLRTNQKIAELIGNPDQVTDVDISTDNQFALGVEENGVYIWKISLGELFFSHLHTSQISRAIFSNDLEYIFFGDENGQITMLNFITGEIVNGFFTDNDYVTSLDISNDGRFLLSGHKSGRVNLWGVED